MTGNPNESGASAKGLQRSRASGSSGGSSALEGCSILMSDLVIETENEDDDVTFVPYGQMDESVRATYLKVMAMEEADASAEQKNKVYANVNTKSAHPQF